MYQLSKTIEAHTRDLRTLDYWGGYLVTGGADKIMNLYHNEAFQQILISKSDIFQKNILSVKINRFSNQPFILVGCADGKIYAFDSLGNPLYIYEHNSAISSIDFINKQFFVTGSWDGKALIWSIKDQKMVRSYDNHKHAVCVYYNPVTDTIVSGSQDKALNIWKWQTGQVVKRKQNVHNDIIRQISVVDGIGFISCSNDQTLKLWDSDLEEIQTFRGHSSFVFTVKAKELGKYYSGGDDKCLKIWDSQTCIQSIQFPSSIWSLVLDQNSDIFIGCSDGYLRIFTSQPTRKASQQLIDIFNKESLQSISKKSGMKAQQIQKLPTIAQMKLLKGHKEGQIRVFRNGLNPQAYMWQNNQWEKIGDVITENQNANQNQIQGPAKYYHGDKYFQAGQYDYIFDVDDQSGTPKIIPFNDGGNPLQAAEKYCMREGLTKGYIQQIRKFLIQNSNRIPRANKKSKKQQIQMNTLLVTPQMSIIEFNDIKNPTILFQKIKEFNQLVDTHKLSEKQLGYIERLATLLEKSSNYHSWTLDFKELDAFQKLLGWPKHHKFPVWDMLRAFLKHYQSQTLFSGLESGLDIIIPLATGLEMENTQPIYALILKVLSNLAIQNSNKNGLIAHAQLILTGLTQISKRKNLQNKNYLSAMATFLYNFSIVILQKNFQEPNILLKFCSVLETRLQIDSNVDNQTLMLHAAANILSKYPQITLKNLTFVKQYLRGDELSKDLQLLLSK